MAFGEKQAVKGVFDMKVAIDLDWTLADFSSLCQLLLGVNKRLRVGELKAIVDAKNSILRDMVYGVWSKYYGYQGVYPSFTDSLWPQALRILKVGNICSKLYLVSLRESDELAAIDEWLVENQVREYFDDVVLLGMNGSKTSVDADVLIDDSLDNCLDYVAEGRRALLWARDILRRRLVLQGVDVVHGARKVVQVLTRLKG